MHLSHRQRQHCFLMLLWIALHLFTCRTLGTTVRAEMMSITSALSTSGNAAAYLTNAASILHEHIAAAALVMRQVPVYTTCGYDPKNACK